MNEPVFFSSKKLEFQTIFFSNFQFVENCEKSLNFNIEKKIAAAGFEPTTFGSPQLIIIVYCSRIYP